MCERGGPENRVKKKKQKGYVSGGVMVVIDSVSQFLDVSVVFHYALH